MTGETLVDVDVRRRASDDAVAAVARACGACGSAGGRIGTLDLADTDLDEVELRAVRIDYLSLAAARITDLLVADCTIGTLDLPQASATRVASRALARMTSTPAACGRRISTYVASKRCRTSTPHRCAARRSLRGRSSTSRPRWPRLSASACWTEPDRRRLASPEGGDLPARGRSSADPSSSRHPSSSLHRRHAARGSPWATARMIT